MTTLLLILGLVTLLAGAELLVRGASRLSAAAGVSPLVIGLTVVAFGTSAGEAAARDLLAGTADLALGNVVGSNVFNVLGILGRLGFGRAALRRRSAGSNRRSGRSRGFAGCGRDGRERRHQPWGGASAPRLHCRPHRLAGDCRRREGHAVGNAFEVDARSGGAAMAGAACSGLASPHSSSAPAGW